MLIFNLLFILVLLIILYEDFTGRAVSVWTLPVLLILVAILNLQTISLKELLINSGINMLVFSVEMLLLYAYFSLKNKAFVQIINRQIGLGDIAFIVIMCFLFSPLIFNFVLVAGLILTLTGYLALRIFSFKTKTIPLAGSLSGMLAVIWIVKWTMNLEVYSIPSIEKLIMH